MFEYVKDRNRKQITTATPDEIKENWVVFEYVKDRNRKQITTRFSVASYVCLLCLNMSKIEIESKSQRNYACGFFLKCCV